MLHKNRLSKRQKGVLNFSKQLFHSKSVYQAQICILTKMLNFEKYFSHSGFIRLRFHYVPEFHVLYPVLINQNRNFGSVPAGLSRSSCTLHPNCISVGLPYFTLHQYTYFQFSAFPARLAPAKIQFKNLNQRHVILL